MTLANPRPVATRAVTKSTVALAVYDGTGTHAVQVFFLPRERVVANMVTWNRHGRKNADFTAFIKKCTMRRCNSVCPSADELPYNASLPSA